MIIPKDATPPARGEADAFSTPKTLDTVLESPGSAFRRVPQSPLTTPLAQIRGRPPRPFASARMPPPPRRLSPEPVDGSDYELERTMCTPVQRHAPARDAPWSAPGAVFRPICASPPQRGINNLSLRGRRRDDGVHTGPLTPPNARAELDRHAARHAVECYVVYGAKLAARRGGKHPMSPGAAAVAAARAKCHLLCRAAGTRRALRRQLVKAVDARRGKESRANGLSRELLSELRGIGSPEPRTPFSPKRMNLRGAVRVPLPPSEIDRVGAELSEMRGGLSRRDIGVALVVAGLGALTLAATVVGA